MVKRFKDGTFVYPGALFRLTPEELAAAAEQRHGRSGGWVGPVTGDETVKAARPPRRRTATKTSAGFDHDDPAEREAA